MPNELMDIVIAILVLAYGVTCYICGKGDLLNVVVLMLQDKAKELEDRKKEADNADN